MSLVGVSAALMFVGFAFKISAAPFQVWAPDVYQGAPRRSRLHVGGSESRGLCDVPPRLHDGVRADCEPLGTDRLGLRAADDDVRQFRRATQTTSSACLPIARSRTPDMSWSRLPPHPDRHPGGDVLPGLLRVHEHRSVRGRHALCAARASSISSRQTGGPGARQPVTAAMLAIFLLSLIGVPLTGGSSVSSTSSKQRWIAPVLADGARPVEQRRGRVLLPADHRRDVHARARRQPPTVLQPLSAG